MSQIENRLAELGMTLPTPAAPVASYVPYTMANGLLFISGQLPFRDGEIMTGRLGDDANEEHGILAAQYCAIGLLAQAKAACEGDLDRLGQCLKLGGFVTSTSEYTSQPKIINGASDLMERAMGDAGRHARAAVGVASLPLGAVVEVDGIFSMK